MDFLVGSFLISLTASEVLGEQVVKDGISIAGLCFVAYFLPYVVGRTMIEPELRLATVRRIVFLSLLLGIPGLFEWRMGRNLYSSVGRIFGVQISPSVQLRAGRGRFASAFTDAEIAGIIMGMVAMLNGWLVYLSRTGYKERLGKLLMVLEKYHIAGILLIVFVFLTQSRGPQLALAVGYLILLIPRFKNTKLAMGVAACAIVIAGAAAYQTFTQITDEAAASGVKSEQQGSALYRRRMLQLYEPILDKGGMLGWGYKSIPHAQGLGNLSNGVQSVDNDFLWVHLAQGTLGYTLLLLIVVESIRIPVLHSWSFAAQEDRVFAICIVAAMAVLWLALATVYMGDQLPQIAFLLIGWGQSITQQAPQSVRFVAPESVKFRFRRVLSR
jgi:hypothetical protein